MDQLGANSPNKRKDKWTNNTQLDKRGSLAEEHVTTGEQEVTQVPTTSIEKSKERAPPATEHAPGLWATDM